MAKSKLPFKTNLDQRTNLSPENREARNRWAKREENKKSTPIKAAVVDVKQERIRLLKWVFKWIVVIPLAGYAIGWILVLIGDAFFFSAN